MALPKLAEAEAVAQRVGGAQFEEPFQCDRLIAYASALVRAYTGRTFMADDTTLQSPLPSGVEEVVVEMVARVASNPEGVTQETTGPFTVSFGANAAERIYLSAGDKAILNPLRARSGLWTQPVTRGLVETETAAVPAGADPFAFLVER